MKIILARHEIKNLIRKYYANLGEKIDEVIVDYDYDEGFYGDRNYKVIGVVKRYIVIDNQRYYAQEEFDQNHIKEIIIEYFKVAKVEIQKVVFDIHIPYDQRDCLEINANIYLKEKVRGRNYENDRKF